MSIDDDILEVLAYHEAGHAVVAWALSVQILEIEIGALRNRVRDALRCRELEPEFMSRSDWKCAEKMALILLGGEMAERAFDDQASDFASETDRQELDDLIQQLFGVGESGLEWLHRMENKAEDIVIDNWTKVRVLAKELLQRRSLSSAEVMHIIRGGCLPTSDETDGR